VEDGLYQSVVVWEVWRRRGRGGMKKKKKKKKRRMKSRFVAQMKHTIRPHRRPKLGQDQGLLGEASGQEARGGAGTRSARPNHSESDLKNQMVNLVTIPTVVEVEVITRTTQIQQGGAMHRLHWAWVATAAGAVIDHPRPRNRAKLP